MADLRTVMVTTDFSDTSHEAFDLASAVATRFDARLLLLNVQHLELPPLVIEQSGNSLAEIERQHEAEALDRLRALSADAGIDAESIVVSGVPHQEIVRTAKERNVDLIVIASHGGGFISRAIMGSTAERVVRRSPCPVLVYRDGDDGTL